MGQTKILAQSVQRPKCCEHEKDEDNSPNSVNKRLVKYFQQNLFEHT